ncbi:RNA-binding protein 48 [Hoplias malabaricus]|uniref:RNA-binding protein 48 n=1 Tax=Hoplias malabaricus TaxID=27720 RepID=UPI0034623963
MAALRGSSVWETPRVYKHHEQQNVCLTRPKYREGRRPKAVKVYTINLESRFLLVQGVPAIGVMHELVQLFALYGAVEEYRVLDEYPAEQFTEVYLIKFQKLTSARAAKRNTDEKSFYGGLLHVCYAPEYETVEDTRKKLQDRRRYINRANQRSAKEDRDQGQQLGTTTSASTESPPSSPAVYEHRTHPHQTQGHSSTSNTYSVPLLPLPPQEEASGQFSSYRNSLDTHRISGGNVATEDKMGSLYSYIPSNSGVSKPASHSHQQVSSGHQAEITRKNKHSPTTVPRFIPRTTHLENRKRKMEDSTDLLGMADKNAPLFGPKLPEPPKMDMEDDSLNKTANMIRQKMTKVSSVPSDGKATTTKPRRRI